MGKRVFVPDSQIKDGDEPGETGKTLTLSGLGITALGVVSTHVFPDQYGLYWIGGAIIGLPLALIGAVIWGSSDSVERSGRNYGLKPIGPIPEESLSDYTHTPPQPVSYSIRLTY